jgi:hypothetical protein
MLSVQRQLQMMCDEWTQPEWRDVANYFHERVLMYRTATLNVLAIVKVQPNTPAAAPVPTTCGVYIPTLIIITSKLHMPQATAQPGESHSWLSPTIPESHKYRTSFLPTVAHDVLRIWNAKSIESVHYYDYLYCPQLITCMKLDYHRELVTTPASMEE